MNRLSHIVIIVIASIVFMGAYLSTDHHNIRGDGGFLKGFHTWSSDNTWEMDDLTDSGYDVTVRPADLVTKGPWVDVRAYGAVGDGTTDDTTSIQAAITAAAAAGSAYQFVGNTSDTLGVVNSVYTGMYPTVYFPKGRYKITSSLASSTYLHYRGNQAIIQSSDNTVDLVTGVKYGNKFEGISFLGGGRGLYIQSANSDTAMIEVGPNCEFKDQITASIASDNNSMSTLLYVHDSKFMNTIDTSYILYIQGVDKVIFDGNWVTSSNDVAFYNNTTSPNTSGWWADMTISNSLMVPVENSNTWVKNYGIVRLFNNRFGGESTGMTIVENQAGNTTIGGNTDRPLGIYMEGNTLYGYNQIVNFYRIPNVVRVKGNYYGVDLSSTSGVAGFLFDSTIPASDYEYFTAYGTWDVDKYLDSPIGPNKTAHQFVQLNNMVKVSTREKKVSDLLISTPDWTGSYGVGVSESGAGYDSSQQYDKFGNGGIAWWYSSAGGYMYRTFSTALSSLPAAGFYTAQINVNNLGTNPIPLRLTLGLNEIELSVPVGEQVINQPFYWNGTDNALGYKLQPIVSGDNTLFTRWTIWTGIKENDTQNHVLWDSAAPTDNTATKLWSVGDIVWNTGSDNVVLWKCTAAGAPGTWASFSLP